MLPANPLFSQITERGALFRDAIFTPSWNWAFEVHASPKKQATIRDSRRKYFEAQAAPAATGADVPTSWKLNRCPAFGLLRCISPARPPFDPFDRPRSSANRGLRGVPLQKAWAMVR